MSRELMRPISVQPQRERGRRRGKLQILNIDRKSQFGKTVHSLSLAIYPLLGWRWAGANPSRHWVRVGSPWTSRQTITGLTYRDKQSFMLTFTPTSNLESPINLNYMSLDCGRKREPTKTPGKHANSQQKGSAPEEYQTQDPLDMRRNKMPSKNN